MHPQQKQRNNKHKKENAINKSIALDNSITLHIPRMITANTAAVERNVKTHIV